MSGEIRDSSKAEGDVLARCGGQNDKDSLVGGHHGVTHLAWVSERSGVLTNTVEYVGFVGGKRDFFLNQFLFGVF